MNTELWVQLAGYVISGLVAVLVANSQNNKTWALMKYRLEQLETKVDKHNNLVERMYKVEAELEAILIFSRLEIKILNLKEMK